MELAILVGLQASGKSTFARLRFGGTHVVVSKDLLRNNRRPSRRQRQLIEVALTDGRSVVVDNTNPTVEDRQELIQLGRKFGAEVCGYYLSSRLEDCLSRNRQRQGKAQVPELAIYGTLKRLQRPGLSEGFDRLIYVRLNDSSGIEEIGWSEDADEKR